MTFWIGHLPITEPFIWSVALAIVGLTGQHIAGKKSHWGWFIGMCAQSLWFVFAIRTEQYGFILLCCAYFGIYWKNWQAWRKEARQEVPVPAP